LAVAAAVLGTAAVLAGCGTSGTPPSGSPTLSSSTAAAPTPESTPAGDIPDNQAFVPFTPPTGLFTVSVPEGWARNSVRAATRFTDKLNTLRTGARGAAPAPNPSPAPLPRQGEHRADRAPPPPPRPQYPVGQQITGHRVVHPWLPSRDG